MNPLDALVAHIERTVGTDIEPWPGGWKGEIDAALIDAVFSIRARYGGQNSGVRRVVNAWRTQQGKPADDLRVLARQDPTALADSLGNHAKIHGRLKTAVVIGASASLVRVGVVHAVDFKASQDQKRAYLQTYGCGPVTWAYFGMLLGRPDFKPDTWIMRFVRDDIPGATTEQARGLLNEAAERLGLNPSALDHAIWKYARTRRG